jgi:NAD(P)-dependent dehydrogenase (short-subunit alcohol dehydrogenase family)
MTLTRFKGSYRAAVFGASGGLGSAFLRALDADPACIALGAASRRPERAPGKVAAIGFDLADEESIAEACAWFAKDGPLDLVLVATGILHDGGALQPEKALKSLTGEALARAFRINAAGPALIAKHALPLLAKDRGAVFAALSARVGSIADNALGGWHAYRASKAALNMLIRNAAIELARKDKTALCVTLHPGTADTALSRPFQGNVKPEKLFTPDDAAAKLLSVIDALTPARTGTLLAWDGTTIPF